MYHRTEKDDFVRFVVADEKTHTPLQFSLNLHTSLQTCLFIG